MNIEMQLIKLRALLAKRFASNKGFGVGELIKILTTVVVGALLLTLIVALINALWPELTQRIFDMFGLGGAGSTPTPSGSTP